MSTQGKWANSNGRAAEDTINDVLIRHRLIALRQYHVGKSIYGTPLYADFYVATAPGFPDGLIIESKWQETQGSADEKLPYLVTNIHQCYPCPTIIVLDGGGFRPGAERWLCSQVGGRLYAVMNFREFLTWCNRNL